MIAALAFQRLGIERLTAWANTRNGRSQRALSGSGSGARACCRRGTATATSVHDVVVFGLLARRLGAQPAARRAR